MNNSIDKEDENKEQAEYIPLSKGVELTGITNATLKRYMLNHAEFINYRKVGREYRLNINDLEKLKLIRKYYSSGMKRDEVHQKLEIEGYPVTFTVNESEELDIISVNQELSEMKKMLQLQNLHQEKLIGELKQELKQEMNKRDELLTRFMKDSMQARKELATALEEEKKKSWWSKLWKK